MITVKLEGNRVVAEVAGKPVGALTFFHNRFHYHPRIYSVVFSDYADGTDTAPVARRLYDRLVQELRPQKSLLLRTGVYEGDAFCTTLRSLGFQDYRRVYFPTLAVAAFDFDLLRDAESMFAASGYTLVRLADLELTAEVEAKLYNLHTEIYADTSTVVPATPGQFSRREWFEATLLSDEVISEACFIAVKGGEFVGFGGLFRDDVAGELETGTFGTPRAYRHHHREIMLAIKAREIAYARAHGYRTIRAEIDAENPWILQICAELPFVQGRDHLSMVRVLNWTVQP